MANEIPFNALIIGPTNSGKTQYLISLLCGPFRGKFDYIVLVCATFVHNKTYDLLSDESRQDDRVYVVTHFSDSLLRFLTFLFEGTNTLFVLDDCAATKDVKGRSNQLVSLAFSAMHLGISVWVLTQQCTSITKPYRVNVACIVLFYTPSVKDTKAIFESYAGELSKAEQKKLLTSLKTHKFSRLVFSLRHPYEIRYDRR